MTLSTHNSTIMNSITIIEREMATAELARMNAGFDEQTVEFGNPLESPERFTYVAIDAGARDAAAFIGVASGLAYRHEHGFSPYFYLSDLFIERPYRGRGLGAELLSRLEARVAGHGLKHIWTWTAGFEAHGFYLKQGYTIFTEFEAWYPSGHSRFGFRKPLSPSAVETPR